ncbi:hypothetical protein Bhyg_06586 [Pseudolycoriella hygida]|uniref:Gag-like protein n=1 Tax=Pseudolycoriella hygida TaxID=35572 RepID=A0A9Q0N2L4_9DIPT|nr:hypothetical protein Bhyg_06586 [Pseudolycoriella hygida]
MKNNQSTRPQPAKVSRKRKKDEKTDISFFNSIQVPLTNRFDALQKDDNGTNTETGVQKKTIISPLIVTDHSTDIDKIDKQLNINYRLKLLSVGRKIMLDSTEDKKRFHEFLVKEKVDFYTHRDNENKVFKVILTGLLQVETGDIITSMQTEHSITPLKVIMFNTSSSNKTYLCHFNRNEVDMKKLNTMTTIHHHIIKWSTYKQKRKGPTQCYRCCMYGHGASTCNRFVACLVCSGNHETRNCSVAIDAEYKSFKCFNCMSAKLQHDHKASDPTCPFRTKYELVRNNVRSKYNNISLAQGDLHKRNYIPAPTPPPLTETFASLFASTSNQSSRPKTRSISAVSKQSQQSNADKNNDLFTIERLTDILSNSINELERCTSKFDQLRVLTNILRNV